MLEKVKAGQGCLKSLVEHSSAARSHPEAARGCQANREVAGGTCVWWGWRNPPKAVETAPKFKLRLNSESSSECPSFHSHSHALHPPTTLPTSHLGISNKRFSLCTSHFHSHLIEQKRTQTRWLPPSVSTWARPTRAWVSSARIGKSNSRHFSRQTGRRAWLVAWWATLMWLSPCASPMQDRPH